MNYENAILQVNEDHAIKWPNLLIDHKRFEYSSPITLYYKDNVLLLFWKILVFNKSKITFYKTQDNYHNNSS